MSRYRVRHFLGAFALLALPALTCGVGPVVQDLIQRVEALEAESDKELIVVDAGGVQVGTGSVLSGGWMEIPFDLEGLPPFVLQASRDGVVGTADRIWFESNDCSGQPWIEQKVSGSTPFLLSDAFAHETRSDLPIYLSDQNAAPQTKTLRSRIWKWEENCSAVAVSVSWVTPAIDTGIYPMTDYVAPFRIVTRGDFLSMQGP